MDRLVIFDVDGTLCDTFGVDDECFCATASAMLGLPLQLSTWEGSPHITDSGIIDWLWIRHLGRSPTREEIDEFIAKFESALSCQLQCSPERFGATVGAPQLLGHLEEKGWKFVFATGGFGKTARLKLLAAGLPVAPLLASSDDSHDRLEIFGHAETRAVAMFGSSPARTVLVGDGIWDVRVAARLGWPFVGVGRGHRAALLLDDGASVVIQDFADPELVSARLTDCAIPRVAKARSLGSGAG